MNQERNFSGMKNALQLLDLGINPEDSGMRGDLIDANRAGWIGLTPQGEWYITPEGSHILDIWT